LSEYYLGHARLVQPLIHFAIEHFFFLFSIEINCGKYLND
jgi:hypothetical protein